jgi:hypothetical protein
MVSLAFRRRVAFLACILPAIYFLGTAAFALLNYGQFASETPQFLRYVLFPGMIGVLFVAAAVIAPARLSMNLGTSMIAVLGGCFAFEALMTVKVVAILLGNFGAGEASALSTANSANGLPPGYTVKRLNRVLGTKELSKAVLSGVPKSKVLLCWRGKEPVFYMADQYGFNNPDNYHGTQIETVVVGDSFIEGMCQSPGQDITSQLRVMRPMSISLGSRGSGPLMQVAMLGRFGKSLRPRHVIFAFFEGNDWENLQEELNLPWLRQALRPNADYGPPTLSNDMRSKTVSILTKVREERMAPFEVLFRTRLIRNFLALNQTMTQLGLAYPKSPPDIPEFVDVLRRIRELAETWGGRITVLYIPQSTRYIGAFPRQFVFDQLRRKVLAATSETGLEVIDMAELFSKQPNPASFYGSDAHFSEQGAAFTAAAINDKIRQLSQTAFQLHSSKK